MTTSSKSTTRDGSLGEIVGMPMTAHYLGGAVISDDPATGEKVQNLKIAVGAARLVGQRIELEVIFGDGADAVGGNDVPREGRARDARPGEDAGQRIVDLVDGADFEQRGEVAVALVGILILAAKGWGGTITKKIGDAIDSLTPAG